MKDIDQIFMIMCICSINLAILVGIVAALIYLIKKTKEEEAAAKAELQQIVNSLPNDKQATFFVQYNANRKNPTTAVLLSLLLGGIGAHKFYLGQTGMGVLYLVFFWTYIPAIIGFVEAFTISRTVFQKNRQVARDVMALLSGNAAALLR